MRNSYDALRSLARYTAQTLGTEWDVQHATDSGASEGRPLAVVKSITPNVKGGTVIRTDLVETFAVNAFPAPGKSPYASQHTAYRIEETLHDMLMRGGNGGHPFLVPLFDYDGAGPDDPSDARRDPDYALVRDFSSRVVQSPSDEMLFTVACEVRMEWSRDGLLPSISRVLERLQINFTGS